MATGIGSASVITQITAPAPDFAMIGKAAASVQNRYLEGFNRYKSTINSILNANLRSDDNIKYRAEYFKKIDEYLNNLSGVDFSNPANVEVASALMDPLINDKEFVYDMNTSMMQSAERAKMEQTRTSTDEKIRSQYSPIMEAAMSYADQDMKNAKRGDGSIYKVGVQRYVPFSDYNNALNEAAKQENLVVKIDELSGAYIVTNKNGQIAVPSFTQWARQQLGNTYDEQLLVTGKVNMRREVESLMQADPTLTKDNAYQQVAKNNSLGIYQNFNEYETSINNGIATIDKEMAAIRTKYKNKIPKNSQDEAYYSQLKNLKTEYQKELSDSQSNKQGKDKQLQTAFQQFMNNPEYSLLPVMKDSIAKNWASGYANATVEREIKVNQYVMNKELQQEARIWEKFMTDYKFQQDISKMKIKAGLDFELKLAEGTVAGGTLSMGSEALSGKSDPFSIYMQDQKSLLDETINGYFNEDVLRAAANVNKGELKYAQLSAALVDVMGNLSRYSGNKFDSAPDSYKANYQTVLSYLRKINPNLNNISNVGQMMQIISSGVRNYRGDADLLKRASQSLEKGSISFNRWAELTNKYTQNVAALRSTGWNGEDYFTTDPVSGQIVPRRDLDEAEKEALYKVLIPNYESDYKNRTAQTSTMWTYNGDPKKFNYAAIDEVLAKAEFVTGTEKSTEFSSTEYANIRNSFATAGGNLSEIFNPAGMTATKAIVGDKDYIKVTIPVNKDTKGKPLIPGVTGQSISFYIPPENASSLWQSISNYSFMGGTIQKPTYGELSNIPALIYAPNRPVSWITSNLTQPGGIARFPDWLKLNGVEDGYLMFDEVARQLRVMIKVDGKELEYPMGLDYNRFMANPQGESKNIMNALQKSIKDIQNRYVSSIIEQQSNHDINVMQFPDNYINADDIS